MNEHVQQNKPNLYQTPRSDINSGSQSQMDSNRGYRMNGMWIAGLLINSVVTLFATMGYGMAMGAIVAVFLFFCFLGTILIFSGAAKIGKGLFIFGSIGFVPIGLVGLFGMRKADEELNADNFWTANY